MVEMRYFRAVHKALHDTMQEDDSVVVFGEDVAMAGGVFKVTHGLHDTFGEARVRDTPISEATIASMGVGAAMTGLKPVVEIMFMDFIALSMDAIVNQAAKARFMFGGRSSVPMVLRTPHGGGLSAGPQHSQCLEAWFAHVPGLKVVCPATPNDAYGMLKTAIQDPDPVIFVEHKGMYAAKGDVDVDATIPLGKARIAREGDHATIVTYGATLNACLKAADVMAEEGVRVEVIDLRSIQPWDKATVMASLQKTHRLLIVHEAVQDFGVGAEIAAWAASEAFDELDAPVLREAAPFMPVPFSRALESQYNVSVDRVCAAVRNLIR